MFDGTGRFHVFVANFGQGLARNALAAGQIRHLKNCPGHILCLQECGADLWDVLADTEWLLTAKDPWVTGVEDSSSVPAGRGDARTAQSPQLVVAGWPTTMTRVTAVGGSTFEANTSGRGPPQPSHWMFVNIHFMRKAAGMEQITLVNMHLNAATMGTIGSTATREIMDQVADGIRSCGARLVCGDANKAIFVFAELMEQRGLQCSLLAKHSGLSVYREILAADDRAVNAAMLHDTVGIWCVGPRLKFRHLSLDAQVVLDAMHPALLTEHKAKNGELKLKVFTRGLEGRSLPKAFAPATPGKQNDLTRNPSERTLDTVLRLWDAHESLPVDPLQDIWQMSWESLQARSPPWWRDLASGSSAPAAGGSGASSSSAPAASSPAADAAAPPPPAAPVPDASLRQATAEWLELQRRQGKFAPTGVKERIQLLDLMPNTVGPGDKFATLMSMIGSPLLRETVAGEQGAGFIETSRWPVFPICTEIPCVGSTWDETGLIWGRNGHFPLLVCVGTNRSHSEDGTAAKNVAKRKKEAWKDSGHTSWPWWIYTESERHFWLPGTESSGRGWSGSSVRKRDASDLG